MAEIPEHLLERSRAARARLTGAEPPPSAEPAADEEAPPAEVVERDSPAAAPEPVVPEPVVPEPVLRESVAPPAEPAPAMSEALSVPVGEPAALLKPLALPPEDRPFVDFAFPPQPDSAAQRYLVASTAWLAVGALFTAIAALRLVAPGFLSGFPQVGYGRAVPVAHATVVLGWLSLVAMSAMFFITPRLCGVPLYGERLAHLSLWVYQAGLAAGVASVAYGYSTGREGLEIPVWGAIPVGLGFVAAAVCVIGTAVRRVEHHVYVSVWYFVAAPVFATFLFAVGYAPDFAEVNRAIVTAFAAQNLIGLWVGAAAIGAAHYVVPRVTGNPLYSHRLAVVGFWSLVFVHIWTGQARMVYGPGPDWLETVAIAFAVTMVVPAVTVAVNLAATMRLRWHLLVESTPAKFAMTGSAFLVLAAVSFGIESVRSFSQILQPTSFPQGTRTLFLLGAFSMYMLAFVYDAVPRWSGRQWLSATASAAHFWVSAIGVALAVLALWGGGIAQGLTLFAGTSTEVPAVFGEGFEAAVRAVQPFHAIAAAGLGLYALGQGIFVAHLYGTLAGVRTLRPESLVPEAPEPEVLEEPAPEVAPEVAPDETGQPSQEEVA